MRTLLAIACICMCFVKLYAVENQAKVASKISMAVGVTKKSPEIILDIKFTSSPEVEFIPVAEVKYTWGKMTVTVGFATKMFGQVSLIFAAGGGYCESPKSGLVVVPVALRLSTDDLFFEIGMSAVFYTAKPINDLVPRAAIGVAF